MGETREEGGGELHFKVVVSLFRLVISQFVELRYGLLGGYQIQYYLIYG